MIRRLLGILVLASMSHLVVAGSDLVCATHGHHVVAEQAPESMPGMHQHDGGGQSEKERCKVPARSDCCEAMTTCSANAALVSAVDADALTSYDAGHLAFVADAPLTRIIAPDPPPPKA